MNKQIPDKVVGRLSLYRSLLQDHSKPETTHVFSHELARMARVSAAQVRRDLMSTGHVGSPNKGYEVTKLTECLGSILDASDIEKVALVGLGHLGRAILDFFYHRRPKLSIVAAFDKNPDKVNKLVNGVKAYHIDLLADLVEANEINTAIIAVPGDQAQGIADVLVSSGVRGILNYAPTPLHVPEYIYLDEQDMTMSLEKVAYFSRRSSRSKGN